MLVYLAGPITGLSYEEATGWRKKALRYFALSSVSCLDPMSGKKYLSGESSIKDSYDDKPLSSAKGIMTRDFWHVSRCDIVLANVLGAKTVSVGTALELGWAYSARKPIVLCMGKGNVHDCGLIRESVNFIVDNLNDGLRITDELTGNMRVHTFATDPVIVRDDYCD